MYGLLGNIISIDADGSFETNHYDYRGSVMGVSDGFGIVIGTVTYDEYGVITQKDESITTRFLYNGKYGVQTDSNGLYYMRARYYSPDLKRFMNRDVIVGSISELQTLNRYAFVNGNPISYHDPFGLAREILRNVSGGLLTMGAVHMGLDIAGMVPMFGMIPDALNTGMYLVKGDFVNATMSSMAIVPGPGDALTAGKLALKYGDDVVGGAKLVGKYGDDVAGVAGKGYTKVTKSPTRLPRTKGSWDGDVGNSSWFSTNDKVLSVTKGEPVVFKDGRPDFTPWSKAEFDFEIGELNGTNSDFVKVREKLIGNKGISNKTQAKDWLSKKRLTPHHFTESQIQLIPMDLHSGIPHIGSASDLRRLKGGQ